MQPSWNCCLCPELFAVNVQSWWVIPRVSVLQSKEINLCQSMNTAHAHVSHRFLNRTPVSGSSPFQKTCARWSTSTTAFPSGSANCTASRWEDPSTAGSTTPAASASAPNAWTTAARRWSAWTVSSEAWTHLGPKCLDQNWGQRKLWLLCVSIPRLPCKISPRIAPSIPADCFYSAVIFHCIFFRNVFQ